MTQTKQIVQFHKKGDADALIYGQTMAEGVIFNDNEDLQSKLSSLLNKIEIVKIGDTALVIGQDKSVVIPDFYNKTESDTKYATKEEVAALPKFGVLVVESLPTTNIQTDKVYLVVTGDETDNLYTEYIRVNNKWEKLGTQRIDISGKQDALTQTQLNAVNSGITEAKVTKYDGYEATINGKQAQLDSTQLSAVNSGINATKVATYDSYADDIAGKQDELSTAQLNAVNSGITEAKVTKYDGYETTINGKQTQLTTAQLNAVNSGIDSTKVSTYDGYAAGKQNTLSTAQLNAANSGITAAKVETYDGYADTIDGLDFVEYTVIKTLS